MKLSLKISGLLTISTLLVTSCATYHITTESLIKQLANTQKEKKVNFIPVFPIVFFPGVVTGNSLREVTVLDKNEKEYVLPVNHRTSVRITKKDGKRKIFYFDTLLIQDSTMTGKMDHFIGTNIKPIKLSNIQKIELQK